MWRIHPFAWSKYLFVFLAVCMDVNMDTCMTSKTQTSPSAKTYCYDVRYSQFDRYPGVMMTDTVWNRRACCEILKNRTVSANFLVNSTHTHIHTHTPLIHLKVPKKAVGFWYNAYLNATECDWHCDGSDSHSLERHCDLVQQHVVLFLQFHISFVTVLRLQAEETCLCGYRVVSLWLLCCVCRRKTRGWSSRRRPSPRRTTCRSASTVSPTRASADHRSPSPLTSREDRTSSAR